MTDVTAMDATAQDVSPCVATPEKVRALEMAMYALPDEAKIKGEELTFHHFCDGVYAREFFLPAGVVAVGKTHARESFFLLLKGIARISVADGTVHTVEAPYLAVTRPGSKRVVYGVTDALFMTFHPNPENDRDLIALEDKFIIPEALPAPDEPEKLT